MKLIDLIEKGKNLPKEYNHGEAFHSLMEELGIYDYSDNDEKKRITLQRPMVWNCTDSWVGLKIYYFDDEPVCVSFQSGRKNNENFEWLSDEAYQKTKKFLYSFVEPEEVCFAKINFDEEIDDFYNVSFYNQLLQREGFVNDKKVTIVEDGDKGNIISEKAVVEYEDSTREIVDVSDIKIAYFS